MDRSTFLDGEVDLTLEGHPGRLGGGDVAGGLVALVEVDFEADVGAVGTVVEDPPDEAGPDGSSITRTRSATSR